MAELFFCPDPLTGKDRFEIRGLPETISFPSPFKNIDNLPSLNVCCLDEPYMIYQLSEYFASINPDTSDRLTFILNKNSKSSDAASDAKFNILYSNDKLGIFSFQSPYEPDKHSRPFHKLGRAIINRHDSDPEKIIVPAIKELIYGQDYKSSEERSLIGKNIADVPYVDSLYKSRNFRNLTILSIPQIVHIFCRPVKITDSLISIPGEIPLSSDDPFDKPSPLRTVSPGACAISTDTLIIQSLRYRLRGSELS